MLTLLLQRKIRKNVATEGSPDKYRKGTNKIEIKMVNRYTNAFHNRE
jgi:hypothetical protein